MITTLTACFTKYLSIPFEDFTGKYITARALFQLMDSFEQKDLDRLKTFEEQINDKIHISLYKLDRNINSSKKEFKMNSNKIIFREKVGAKIIETELSENEMQNLLCIAIREVHEIILRNMKKYQLEQPVNMPDSAQDEDMIKTFLGV